MVRGGTKLDQDAASLLLDMLEPLVQQTKDADEDVRAQILKSVLEEQNNVLQDRFRGDAVHLKAPDKTRSSIGMMARDESEYLQDTIAYLPEDLESEDFYEVVDVLLEESDRIHWHLWQIDDPERRDNLTHNLFNERRPFKGQRELLCTKHVALSLKQFAKVIRKTVKDLQNKDGQVRELRWVGRQFYPDEVQQTRYAPALELLYGIFIMRRVAVIFGDTRPAAHHAPESPLGWAYEAMLIQTQIKLVWHPLIDRERSKQTPSLAD